ncbi:NAD-glutamate dehydrogenase [Ahrensia kielensis]|uniref:NAD-glutamate dehydrogenase n=1 Tax=Ahrensia kielensis TaxID=76980 RepID=A0ABU9T8U0_9HYPH
MGKTLTASAKRILQEVSAKLSAMETALAEPLLGAAYAEDLAIIEIDTLAAAIKLSSETLSTHKKGESIVEVQSITDELGKSATIVSIINENMPFLFDSVLGEINERASDVHMVVHPVLDVKHTAKGFDIIDKSRPGLAREKTLRTSVIVAILPQMSDEARETLKNSVISTLVQVKAAVRDWQPMQSKMSEIVQALTEGVTPARKKDIQQAVEFLSWLRDDNFTFLGIREYNYVGGEKTGKLVRADQPSLGILNNPDIHVLRRGDEPVTTTPEIRAFLTGRDVLIVTKANFKSVVHRRTYMDYIGIKKYNDKGKLSGEIRIVGLFTSAAYTRSVKRVPYIKSKIETVIARSDYEADSHSGKALLNILEDYPRDELFQVDAPTLLRNAEAILALTDRPRVRVLSRIDPFDRFVSSIVYVPRDRYSSENREKICAALADAYDGHVSAYYPAIPEGMLARVHVIIGRRSGETPKPTQASLERTVNNIIRTWEDALREEPDLDAAAFNRFSFSDVYRDTVSAAQAVRDVDYLEKLSIENPIAADFHAVSDDTESKSSAALRIYHLGAPVPLSERVPILENMGFRVIDELSYEVTLKPTEANGPISVFLHEMRLESASGEIVPMEDCGALYEESFVSVWSGANENDRYNGLVLSTGFNARQVTALRAYGRYLKQAGIAFSQDYLASTLIKHSHIARQLFDLFDARFNPDRAADPEEDTNVTQKHIKAAISDSLSEVPNIDEDRVIRRFLNLIEATLRTSYFQHDENGQPKRNIAFKFDPHQIDGIPAPKPYREIYVFAPDVEGLHLRFGPIARGGLRWSDRSEDYRTEVLGLVKAQQVKNAVIVPVGSKGAFYPMRLPKNGSRDEIYEAGRSAYMTFISSLLSLTDNLDGDTVIPPLRTVRHDGDDPYLVVAADKGTASFSDTANGISQGHDFWLDDAFASGGSAGYDHKKMGITARGAWEAVKRHFREMDKDIQEEPFTVAGVGDMSGDVFGNGMLLSKQIKLIAAFDHRDIFIDPDPDPASSFKERERIFNLGRSSWQDYDTKKLSKGGGIFPRSQKIITLSKAAADAIGLDKTKASPTEILTAILKAEVELFWFGGIGTYIRASHESNSEVGDKANDPIRVAAKDVRAKVLGEGANLGVTQPARIEYGLLGGRCNSDAIDNSAGVNSSDVEVNIKIAFAPSMRDGSLPREKRNKLLESMTDNVAELVLENNYEQTLTISRTHERGASMLSVQKRLMESLEDRGLLDREVEDLPNDEELAQRLIDGTGLTRSEIGVLLSYAKIVLLDDLVASDVPDDPYLEKYLMSYFPKKMQKDFADNIRTHRLRREIIGTVLANEVVNKGGPSVISRFEDATGVLPSTIVRAHVITRDAYNLPQLNAAIDALDGKVSGSEQLSLYKDLSDSQRTAISGFIKTVNDDLAIADHVARLSAIRDVLEGKLMSIIPQYLNDWAKERHQTFKGCGLSDTHAKRLALLPILTMAPDMAAIMDATNRDVLDVAQALFAVSNTFKIGRLEHLANLLETGDYFDGLAQQRALDTIHTARNAITISALSNNTLEATAAVEAWHAANEVRILRVQERISDLTDKSDLTVSRLTVAAGLLTDLVS